MLKRWFFLTVRLTIGSLGTMVLWNGLVARGVLAHKINFTDATLLVLLITFLIDTEVASEIDRIDP